MKYQGNAHRIKIFLRNFDPRIAKPNDGNSSQYIFTEVTSDEINNGEISIPLSRFTVADWWIYQYNLHRKYAQPQFEHISAIGIDISGSGNDISGTHAFVSGSLTLRGKIVSESNYYLLILSIWMVSLFLHLLNQLNFQKARAFRYRRLKKQLEKENKKLEHISEIDPLTQLLNRRGFQAKLTDIEKPSNGFAVFMLLDIDHFKSINDTHGHNFGDFVLESIGKTLIETTRNQDIVARWGGEEFGVYCQIDDLRSAITIAEKIRTTISAIEFPPKSGLSVTASIGLSLIEEG